MKIDNQAGDAPILEELGARLARVRIDRRLTQAELARQAAISKRTLERMESGGPTQLVNLIRVCRVLGLLERFEALVPAPAPSPLAQLKLRGREPRRVKPSAGPAPAAARPARGKWRWGDEQ